MKSVLRIYSVLGLAGLHVQANQTLQSDQQATCTALHESLLQPSFEKGERQQSSKQDSTVGKKINNGDENTM